MNTVFTLYRRWIVSFSTILLLAGATTGGYYYVRHTQRETHLREASYRYERLLPTNQAEAPLIPLDKASAFIKQYPDTPYAALVQLQLAAQAVKHNQLKEAIQWLEAAAKNSQDPAIRAIARQRGARILASLREFKVALEWLNGITCDSYAALTEEIKGDIFHASGAKDKALQAYRRAYAIESALSQSRPLLQIKINDLDTL